MAINTMASLLRNVYPMLEAVGGAEIPSSLEEIAAALGSVGVGGAGVSGATVALPLLAETMALSAGKSILAKDEANRVDEELFPKSTVLKDFNKSVMKKRIFEAFKHANDEAQGGKWRSGNAVDRLTRALEFQGMPKAEILREYSRVLGKPFETGKSDTSWLDPTQQKLDTPITTTNKLGLWADTKLDPIKWGEQAYPRQNLTHTQKPTAQSIKLDPIKWGEQAYPRQNLTHTQEPTAQSVFRVPSAVTPWDNGEW